jgi:membrane protease YdiL (CAAX protease family)
VSEEPEVLVAEHPRPPWDGKGLLKAFSLGIVLTFAFIIVMVLAGADSRSLVGFFIAAGVVLYCSLLLSICFFILRGNSVTLADLGLVRPSVRMVAVAIGQTLVVVIAETLVVGVITAFFQDVPSAGEQFIGTDQIHVSALQGWVLGFIVVALGPLVEELIFRALILRYLSGRMPLLLAVGLTTGLFAIAHGWTPLFIDFFFLGLVLSVVAIRSGNITSAILLHGLHNGLALLALLSVT